MTLGAAAAAVVAFDPALHGPGPSIGRPLLRCLIKGDTGIYEVLDGLVVEKIELSVDVKGVRNLVVQNADGPLNASQPMPLFGSQPQIGAPFYIGSAEVFSKRLTSLDLHLEWKSPPADLFDHYRAYFDSVDDFLTDNFHTFFQADVDLLYDRSFRRLLVNQLLFAPVATDPQDDLGRPPARSTRRSREASIWSSRISNSRMPSIAGSRYGFVRLVLTEPDPERPRRVCHDRAVRSVRSQRVLPTVRESGDCPQQVDADADREAGPAERAVHAGAQARCRSTTARRRSSSRATVHAAGTFLIVGPFGATRAGERAAARVVPQIDGEAALFLGIEHMQPPANLSLFFQIDVGTASSAEVLKPGDTEWSYLAAGDSWRGA